MELHTLILNHFLDTDLKIKSLDKLNEYINFCLINRTQHVKGKTAKHHILPKSKNLPFTQFSDLKLNDWNQSILSHDNHYLAHWLLYDAIDHYSIVYSFIAMNNKNKKIISENLLMDANKYKIAMEERSNLFKIWANTISDFNPNMTNGTYYATLSHEKKKSRLYDGIPFEEWQTARMSNDKNIVHYDGVVDKIRNTKSNTYINGKNLDTISAERAAAKMKEEFIDVDGNLTNIYKQSAIKISNTVNKEIIVNGTSTTIAKLRGSINSKKLTMRGNKYILKSVLNENLYHVLYASDIRKISPALEKLTKENYLGKSKFGYTTLNKKGKSNLIGLYTIKTDLEANIIDDIDEFIKNL